MRFGINDPNLRSGCIICQSSTSCLERRISSLSPPTATKQRLPRPTSWLNHILGLCHDRWFDDIFHSGTLSPTSCRGRKSCRNIRPSGPLAVTRFESLPQRSTATASAPTLPQWRMKCGHNLFVSQTLNRFTPVPPTRSRLGRRYIPKWPTTWQRRMRNITVNFGG